LAKVLAGVGPQHPQMSSCRGRHGRSCGKKAAARSVSSRHRRLHSRVAGSLASRWITSSGWVPAKLARKALDDFSSASSRTPPGMVSPIVWTMCPWEPARGTQGAVEKGGAALRRRKASSALSERASQCRTFGGQTPGRRRAWSSGRASSWKNVRHRFAKRRLTQRQAARGIQRKSRFSHRSFLGKEPAQNILAFRFANGLFEPIWNRNFIDHVQDRSCPRRSDSDDAQPFTSPPVAYRDMVVTHLFQILGFMAMEPPTALLPAPISEEKNKVFPQYAADPTCGRGARPVHRLPRRKRVVDPRSDTGLHCPACFIDNWRWAGVPFFLRTGKRLAEANASFR